jgi:hypothetical protein
MTLSCHSTPPTKWSIMIGPGNLMNRPDHLQVRSSRYFGSRFIWGLSYKTAFNNELLTSILPL